MSLLVMEMQVSKNKDCGLELWSEAQKSWVFLVNKLVHKPKKLVQMWTSQILSHFRLTIMCQRCKKKASWLLLGNNFVDSKFKSLHILAPHVIPGATI
jgi:hypothetical protein